MQLTNIKQYMQLTNIKQYMQLTNIKQYIQLTIMINCSVKHARLKMPKKVTGATYLYC